LPKLKPVGLDWCNFQVMRRTNASLMKKANVDPKVGAHQRGHGIGVSLDVYTHSDRGEKGSREHPGSGPGVVVCLMEPLEPTQLAGVYKWLIAKACGSNSAVECQLPEYPK
jgi:hypothetical protein